MSYNIDHCEYLKGGPLKIKRSKAAGLREELRGRLAEGNFLDALDLSRKLHQNEMLDITRPWWYGESSGNTYETLQEEVLTQTVGEAIILFVWEGGDSRTALHVKDGKVTEKKVKITAD